MNKKAKIIIGFISLIVVLLIVTIISIIFITIKEINKKGNEEFYTIGNDKIPSITSVVGKRTTNSISINKTKGVTTKKYGYINVKYVQSDIDNYISMLKNNNFVSTTNIDLRKKEGSLSLATTSVDNEYIIILNIIYDDNSYTIELKKGIGSITEFK